MYSVRILSDDGSVIVETSPSVYIKKGIVIGRCKVGKFVQGYVDVWTGSEGLWKVMILRKGIVYEENS